MNELSGALINHGVDGIPILKNCVFLFQFDNFWKLKVLWAKERSGRCSTPRLGWENVNILLLTKHNLFGAKNRRFLHINIVRHIIWKQITRINTILAVNRQKKGKRRFLIGIVKKTDTILFLLIRELLHELLTFLFRLTHQVWKDK